MEAATPVLRNTLSQNAKPTPASLCQKRLVLVESKQQKQLVRALRFLAEDLLAQHPQLATPSSWVIQHWVNHYLWKDTNKPANTPSIDLCHELVCFLRRLKFVACNAASDDPALFPPAKYFSLALTSQFATAGLDHFSRIKNL